MKSAGSGPVTSAAFGIITHADSDDDVVSSAMRALMDYDYSYKR